MLTLEEKREMLRDMEAFATKLGYPEFAIVEPTEARLRFEFREEWLTEGALVFYLPEHKICVADIENIPECKRTFSFLHYALLHELIHYACHLYLEANSDSLRETFRALARKFNAPASVYGEIADTEIDFRSAYDSFPDLWEHIAIAMAHEMLALSSYNNMDRDFRTTMRSYLDEAITAMPAIYRSMFASEIETQSEELIEEFRAIVCDGTIDGIRAHMRQAVEEGNTQGGAQDEV